MSFGTFLFPPLGGYIFLILCNMTRFERPRQDGYRLLFNSAFVGAHFLFIAYLLLIARSKPEKTFEIKAEEVIACLFGPLCALIINAIYSKKTGEDRALIRSSDEMEFLLVNAMPRKLPVEIILKNGDICIGLIMRSGVGISDRKFIAVSQLVRLTMDKSTGNFKLIEDRTDKVTEMDLSELENARFTEIPRIVFPIAEIQSVSLFEEDLST